MGDRLGGPCRHSWCLSVVTRLGSLCEPENRMVLASCRTGRGGGCSWADLAPKHKGGTGEEAGPII